MQTEVVELVPGMASNGGAVVGPGATIPVPGVGLGVTVSVPGVGLGVTVSVPGVGLGVTVSVPGVGLGVTVPCHRGLWDAWFSRVACAALGDRAFMKRRMLVTTSSGAAELRTYRARIGFLSLPFKRGSAVTRTESGDARSCSDQLSTPGAA